MHLIPISIQFPSMKLLLIIDTASPHTTVALKVGGRILEHCTDRQRQAAQQVLPLLQQLLSQTGTSVADLEGIGVINGPGSFTGMRIGVAVAQGLARAARVPVVPISSLTALGVSARSHAGGDHWLVAMHAREDEHYLAAYQIDAGVMPQTLLGECIVSAESLPRVLATLPAPDQWFGAGDSFANEEFQAVLGRRLVSRVPEPKLNMECLFDMLELTLATGDDFKPEAALPNYVKEQMDYS